MEILVHNLSKKFRQEFVIREFSYSFKSGKSYALTGPNGSGKSTLLQLIAQFTLPNKGKVEMGYKDKGYVYASPAQTNPISGTEVRNWLKAGDEQSKKDFLKAYPKFDENIFKLITLKLSKLSEEEKEYIRKAREAGKAKEKAKEMEEADFFNPVRKTQERRNLFRKELRDASKDEDEG